MSLRRQLQLAIGVFGIIVSIIWFVEAIAMPPDPLFPDSSYPANAYLCLAGLMFLGGCVGVILAKPWDKQSAE